MRISHGTRISDINPTNGYGYATSRMIESLTRLGYVVNQNDATADVEIWFDQPHHWDFNPNSYKIGYHPWESTHLKPGWADIMNQCDEIWTPSPLIAKWYRTTGKITVPVHVYLHGVDEDWSVRKRKVEDKMLFLHCGMEASRKGASEAMRAFKQAFPGNEDVGLTMKTVSTGWNMPTMGKTTILGGRLPFKKMVELYHNHHVYVYPSWGEGFGLTPLQAMATGMPTITLPAWAPYADFLDENLSIGSRLVLSPWRHTHHPGKMFKPRFDDIVDRLRYAYENYDEVHAYALDQTDALRAVYDWDSLTKTAFENLEERLQNRSK